MFTQRRSVKKLFTETHRLDGRLQMLSDRTARPLGLSAARTAILEVLIQQPHTVAQIGRRLGLTRQSVQRTVDLMTEERLVRAIANPDHRRAKLIELTAEAADVLGELHEQQQRLSQSLTSGLTDDELGEATGVLETLRQRIEELPEAT